MTTELVLVHGRAQQGKDADQLKGQWLEALNRGMAAAGLRRPVPDDDVRFPYYGDTLEGLLSADPSAPTVTVRGDGDLDEDELAFLRGVVDEVVHAWPERADLPPAEWPKVVQRSPLIESALPLLRRLDRHVPGASATTIALVTHDVYTYLRRSQVKRKIDEGVASAFATGERHVVVAHSLGSVVSYEVLHEHSTVVRSTVPLLVTLGSPLAVNKIRMTVHRPTSCPRGVQAWFNARDPRDVVALHPLDTEHFPLDPPDPAIDNDSTMKNTSNNHHGIEPYLEDPRVARRIHDALVTV